MQPQLRLRNPSTTASDRALGEQRRTPPTEDDYFFELPQDATRIGLTDWTNGRRVAEAAYRHMAALLEQAGSLSALIKSTS